MLRMTAAQPSDRSEAARLCAGHKHGALDLLNSSSLIITACFVSLSQSRPSLDLTLRAQIFPSPPDVSGQHHPQRHDASASHKA